MAKHCRHCHSGKICRPRGLCWTCYYAPGIRDRYPAQGVPVVREAEHKPLAPWPTPAQPGSPAKLAVLCQRATAKWALWHPGDAR